MSLQRVESAVGWHELARRRPAPALRGVVVADYTGYEERTSVPVRRLEVPSPAVALILSFEHPIAVSRPALPERSAERHRSFVAALDERPAVTEHAGEQCGIEVNLSPLGAGMLLGRPMHELSNHVVELEDVLGRDGRELIERLADAPGWSDRFALLDAELTRRLAAARPPPPAVVDAVGRLMASGGGTRIDRLAAETGWSRRQLGTRFREHVGLPPKSFARIVRFDRVRTLLAEPGPERLAAVAYGAGYSDQSHFNRDFRAYAGVSPTEYVARLRPGGDGVSA